MSISTEGLARACATHPKRTLAAWLVAVFVSFVVIALLLGDALTSDGDVTSNPDSKQASALIRDSFPPQPTPSEIVVVRSEALHGRRACVPGEGAGDRRARGGARRRRGRAELIGLARPVARLEGSPRDDGAARDAKRRDRSARRPGAVGERARRLPGRDHRLTDGRRRLREALGRRPAEGRALHRAACRADHPRARVRGGRGGSRPGAARAARRS